MHKIVLACGFAMACFSACSAASNGAATLTVAVDHSGEKGLDGALLASEINNAYNAEKRWFSVRPLPQGDEAVIADAEKDQDIIALLDRLFVGRKGLAITKVVTHGFWFSPAADASGTDGDWQRRSSRLEDFILSLRAPIAGLTIEDAADGAVVRAQDPALGAVLRDQLHYVAVVEPLSSASWHVSWKPDVHSGLEARPVGKFLAFLLRAPLNLAVQPFGRGVVFFLDDKQRYAGFVDAVHKAFSPGTPYVLRETQALLFRVVLNGAPPAEGLGPDDRILSLMTEMEETVNPSIETLLRGDSVLVRARDRRQMSRCIATVRKSLEARTDVTVTALTDGALEIRLKPGVHLLSVRPAVDEDRLAQAIRTRAVALKLHAVRVKPAGPERADITFAGPPDAAAFRQSLLRGSRLSMRLVDEETKPEPGSEKLPAKTGPALWLKPGVLVTGDMVAGAEAFTDPQTGMGVVLIHLSEDGRALFAAVTRAHIGERIAVVMDGEIVTAPSIREPIEVGAMQISGAFTLKEAKALAAAIVPASDLLSLKLVEP